MEDGICEFLARDIQFENIFKMLEFAHDFGLSSLITSCGDFCDKNAVLILEHPQFLHLSSNAVSTLISKTSFYAPEKLIFESVTNWMDKNGGRDDGVLKHVRLSLMSMGYLELNVRPTNYFSSELISTAIKESLGDVDNANRTWKHRGFLPPISDISMFDYGLEISGGTYVHIFILNGNIFFMLINLNIYVFLKLMPPRLILEVVT